MYETILVPTDGSEAATEAAEEAVDLADALGSTVHALYAVDLHAILWAADGSDLGFDVDAGDLRRDFERYGEEETDAVADLAADRGVAVETAVVEGTPYREILRYAEDHGADLIVMGTYGRRGLDTIFGSTTERVVRRSEVPVLAVRKRDE